MDVRERTGLNRADMRSIFNTKLMPVFFLKTAFKLFWNRCLSFNDLVIGQRRFLNHKVRVIGGGAFCGGSGLNFRA